MALTEGREFTVQGKDNSHFRLQHFACTAVPLRDAGNKVIDAVNLSTIDRSNPTFFLFARQLPGRCGGQGPAHALRTGIR